MNTEREEDEEDKPHRKSKQKPPLFFCEYCLTWSRGYCRCDDNNRKIDRRGK
jgi:hypothetical protein